MEDGLHTVRIIRMFMSQPRIQDIYTRPIPLYALHSHTLIYICLFQGAFLLLFTLANCLETADFLFFSALCRLFHLLLRAGC